MAVIDPPALMERVNSVPSWFHSIRLADGVTTPGVKSAQALDKELASLQLPQLADKSVLDIGAWDGFFSFAAESRGAARVVALDHYVWSMDLVAQVQYFHECHARGEKPPQWETVPSVWRPHELPGKRGFDAAHDILGSRVESTVGDLMTMDLEAFGRFDVVLYLGVLYHMKNPLSALERVAEVTRELAVIETSAVAIADHEHLALCEFYESDELNLDVTNWWGPNLKALHGLCRAAGFRRVETQLGPGDLAGLPAGQPHRYRAIIHAWK